MTVVLTDGQAEVAHLLGLLYSKYGKLLLNYEEAADALGIHESTVKRHTKSGRIVKTVIGGRVGIPITEVIRITREGI
jgi:excisionase family DNA binding protein